MAKDPKRPAKPKPVKSKPVKPEKAAGLRAAGKAAKKGGGAAPGAAARKTRLPLPQTLPAATSIKPSKRALTAEARHLGPLEPGGEAAEAGILDRLWQTVEERRASGDTSASHSARLLARGTAKVAQKLGEEAVECLIEATLGNREATVLESADLLYHLLVVWVDAGIRPAEVWAELARRQGISGIVEKASRSRGIVRAARTTKLP